MHHRMPPSKTGRPSLNVVIFSTCDAPRPGRPKTVTTPEITDQIHELILGKPPGFSQINSWATGHLTWVGWDYHSWKFRHTEALREVGPEMSERGSKTSAVPAIWENFGAIQIISCRDRWPWTKPGCITMIRRQSNNQWSGGIAAHPTPKNSECKNRWISSRLNFLGSRRHSPHCLSSKRPNYEHRLLRISAGAIEGHFEGKRPREVHQGGLVLTRQCAGSPGTCNPEETGLPGLPVSWSPTPFSGSGPVGLPPVPWTEKTIERSPFFVQRGGHCCRGDLVGRTIFWIFFFEWLAKVRATG